MDSVLIEGRRFKNNALRCMKDGVLTRSHHDIWFCQFQASPLRVYTSSEPVLDVALLSNPSVQHEVLLVATHKQLVAVTFQSRWQASCSVVISALQPGKLALNNSISINPEARSFAVRCSDAVLIGQWDEQLKPTLTNRLAIVATQCDWVPQTPSLALLTVSGLILHDTLTSSSREPLLSKKPRLIAALGDNTLAVICEPAASVYSSANADMFQALRLSTSTTDADDTQAATPSLLQAVSSRTEVVFQRSAAPDLTHQLVLINVQGDDVSQQEESLDLPLATIDCACAFGQTGLALGSNSSSRVFYRDSVRGPWQTLQLSQAFCVGLAWTTSHIAVATMAVPDATEADQAHHAVLPTTVTKEMSISIRWLPQTRNTPMPPSQDDTNKTTLQQLKAMMADTHAVAATVSAPANLLLPDEHDDFQLKLPGHQDVDLSPPAIEMVMMGSDHRGQPLEPKSRDAESESRLEQLVRARFDRLQQHVDQRLDRIETTLGLLLRTLGTKN
eukprot:m.131424 g.131424  ORF g.131424 m.131424 type:complete len:503 (+) comp15910_c0_seq1:870-2378(+)